MQSNALTVKEYIDSLPADQKKIMSDISKVILKNLPDGFKEMMSYGMIGYVVPHKLYPAGYHCNTDLPLPFINLASQKNYISLYHLALYKGELPDLANGMKYRIRNWIWASAVFGLKNRKMCH